MLSLWRRSRLWVRAVGLLVLLGVAGAGVYWFGFRDEEVAATSGGSTTSAVAASLTTIEQSVTGSGTLTPTVQEDVSFAVSGTVTSVDVAAGDTVTAGQQLATVDTLNLNADLLSAQADLASAEADLSDAEDEADGSDSSDAQIAALEAKVDVAQASVDSATEDMADATLTAPVSGLLTEVNLEVGDAVTGSGSSSGSDSSGGTTGTTTTTTSSAQFVIIGTDSWEISVTVDETDVALIAVGDQAEITVEDATDTIYGTVSEIGLISSTSGSVASYPVVIQVTGSPDDLNDGVSADVSIIYEKRTDVLTIPSSAVTTADGESTVQQEGDDGETVTTAVTTGETSGTLVEITSGLSEGDEVLVTTFTPGTGSSDSSGSTSEDGSVPSTGDFSGEMPDMSEMQGGGSMPGGSNG